MVWPGEYDQKTRARTDGQTIASPLFGSNLEDAANTLAGLKWRKEKNGKMGASDWGLME